MRLLLIFIFSSHLSFSQDYGWTSNVDIEGLGRDDAVAFTFNSIIYLGTGNHGGFSQSNVFYGYDTKTSEWISVPVFPGVARQYSTFQTIEEKAYLIGGVDSNLNPLNEVWEFDMIEQIWTQKNNFPFQARWASASFMFDDLIYVGTGRDTIQHFNDFWRYDPSSDAWTEVASFPLAPRFETIGFALYNKGYCGLGKDSSENLRNDLWQYDPDTDSWKQRSDFPGGQRWYAKAEVLNGWAFVGTGEDENGEMKSDFWKYDASKDVWEQAESVPLPARRGVTSCVIPFKGIYWISGLDDTYSRMATISRYTIRIGFNPEVDVFYNSESESVFITELPFPATVRIFNIEGKLMTELIDQNDHYEVNTSSWSKGVYLVTIFDQSYKFMVR